MTAFLSTTLMGSTCSLRIHFLESNSFSGKTEKLHPVRTDQNHSYSKSDSGSDQGRKKKSDLDIPNRNYITHPSYNCLFEIVFCLLVLYGVWRYRFALWGLIFYPSIPPTIPSFSTQTRSYKNPKQSPSFSYLFSKTCADASSSSWWRICDPATSNSFVQQAPFHIIRPDNGPQLNAAASKNDSPSESKSLLATTQGRRLCRGCRRMEEQQQQSAGVSVTVLTNCLFWEDSAPSVKERKTGMRQTLICFCAFRPFEFNCENANSSTENVFVCRVQCRPSSVLNSNLLINELSGGAWPARMGGVIISIRLTRCRLNSLKRDKDGGRIIRCFVKLLFTFTYTDRT